MIAGARMTEHHAVEAVVIAKAAQPLEAEAIDVLTLDLVQPISRPRDAEVSGPRHFFPRRASCHS